MWCPLESSRTFVACAFSITLASFFSKMAAKFTALDVHDLLDEDDEFSFLEGEDSDDEDVGVCGYLPEVDMGAFGGGEEYELADSLEDEEDEEEEASLASPDSDLGTVGQFSGRSIL